MSDSIDRRPSPALSTLPGVPILLRVRRLIVIALITAFVYSTVTVASAGQCAGGGAADGGYVDAHGQPTDVVPQCVTLTLGPSFWVLLAIGLTVVLALTRVLKNADDLRSATRILDRAAVAIVAIASGSVLISHIWFFAIPLDSWDGSGPLFFPFPFGAVESDITPIGT